MAGEGAGWVVKPPKQVFQDQLQESRPSAFFSRKPPSQVSSAHRAPSHFFPPRLTTCFKTSDLHMILHPRARVLALPAGFVLGRG